MTAPTTKGLFPRVVPIYDMTRCPQRYRFYNVPAGTPWVLCRGPNCRRPMYWINEGGKKCIDCNVTGGVVPSINKPGQIDAFQGTEEERGAPAVDGRGVLHHLTCPDVELFRREKTRLRGL